LADSGWFSFTATKYNFLELGRYLTWLGYAATYCKVVKDTILDLDFIHDGSAAEQINVANNNILSSSPNPFNPATNFYLRLPEETFVTMKIFDTQGRIVKVLRNGKMHKGQDVVRWNTENIPFGIYYVVLTVGNTRHVLRTVRAM
jgi:hypothetical protein